MPNVKKTLLFTFYYANNAITCIRCNISGKFVSIKKYLATQKANAIFANTQANKPSNGYLSIIVMLVLLLLLTLYAITQSSSVNNNITA